MATAAFVLFVSAYDCVMTTLLGERTVLPPERPERLGQVLLALRGDATRRAVLVGPDGVRLELPAEVFEVLRDVVEALSRGLAITVAPHETVLSTSEAAGILGVSRPTLVRLLESGEIPFEQPGTHRRVRLADVLAYHERALRRRAVGLDRMVAEAEDTGFYELPDDAAVERLPADEGRKQPA